MKEKDKVISEEIKDKTFNEYQKSSLDSSSVIKCYQKKYRDTRGIKYFIDVKLYKIIHPTTKEDLGGYEISGQFYLKPNHDAVNMEFLDSTISEVESFIDKLFDSGDLDYYELYY